MVLMQKNPPQIEGRTYLGEPLPSREIRLNSDGEICVRGETLFTGYLFHEKQNGWFKTGDIGELHPLHGIAIVGRKDWQFISGGENIQPEEIEERLLQIPGVVEAIVIPKEDPEFGMRPIAILRTEGPFFTLEKMQGTLRDFLPQYKIPIALHIVDEMPKNGLKIDRWRVMQSLGGGMHGNEKKGSADDR